MNSKRERTPSKTKGIPTPPLLGRVGGETWRKGEKESRVLTADGAGRPKTRIGSGELGPTLVKGKVYKVSSVAKGEKRP